MYLKTGETIHREEIKHSQCFIGYLLDNINVTIENSHILPLLIFDTIYPVSTNSQYELQYLCLCLVNCIVNPPRGSPTPAYEALLYTI